MAEIPFALVLGLGAIIAAMIASRARKQSRSYIAFAAALYGALAIVICIAASMNATALASAAALLVAALGAPVLALAVVASFAKPPRAIVAALVLSLCVVAAIAAAMNSSAALAFAPLFAAVCAILVVALRERSLYAGLGAGAFLAAAASFMAGGQTGFLLFSAAGLLGIASDPNIAGPRQTRRLAIRGPH